MVWTVVCGGGGVVVSVKPDNNQCRHMEASLSLDQCVLTHDQHLSDEIFSYNVGRRPVRCGLTTAGAVYTTRETGAQTQRKALQRPPHHRTPLE